MLSGGTQVLYGALFIAKVQASEYRLWTLYGCLLYASKILVLDLSESNGHVIILHNGVKLIT